jgi:hypothetical protein
MVKRDKGFNAATHDWEFFELDVSKDGTQIRKRGTVDVVNRFGGNCFSCHVPAAAQWDLVCETGHGCAPLPVRAPEERGNLTMTKTYRDVAIEQMIATVEEAMSRVIDWWGELPMPMNEAIDRFRVQLGAAIDSVEFVKRALDRPAPETPHREGR